MYMICLEKCRFQFIKKIAWAEKHEHIRHGNSLALGWGGASVMSVLLKIRQAASVHFALHRAVSTLFVTHMQHPPYILTRTQKKDKTCELLEPFLWLRVFFVFNFLTFSTLLVTAF